MSKVKLEKHIDFVQKQQIKIKERNSKYVPGTLNLQILGSGAPGAPASVYLFTDQSRYLFNCGEGTQRLAHEHKTKLTRLEHIFITQTSWSRIGGLPGLSLTIQDAGVPSISLHGPPKLDELFKAMRNFVILKQLKVEAPECGDAQFYEDCVLRIDYVPLMKADCDSKSVMAFICRCKSRPGTLSLKKCLDRGVPKGPLLGKLKNGENVTLENGITVNAADVCEPDDPGPIFIVLDIPSIDYMDSLKNAPKITELQNNNLAIDDMPTLILHFSPNFVITTNEYQEFISKFSKTTKHLILNETNKFSGYAASYRIQWQLNQLNDNIFPILKLMPPTDSEESKKGIKLCKNENGINMLENSEEKVVSLESTNSMTCFHLRPSKKLDRSIEASVNPEEFINEVTQLDGVPKALNELHEQTFSNKLIDRTEQYPKIVFLGTGSCIPNKTRNVSSILVHTNVDTCILLDVGEGTCGQIIRFYGNEAASVFRKIKGIYLSHMHADHHIGLLGVVEHRRNLLQNDAQPIILMTPVQIESWLQFYDAEIERISSEFILIPNRQLIIEDLSIDQASTLGITCLRTCFVPHCSNSFGVTMTIEHEKPFKLTYSGDSMPCENLIKLGTDSTLLIHEATMEDELVDDALGKMHSTVSQAIEQGQKMNAKYCILTHFSQRYAKIPRIEHHLINNVGIAFDNMEVVPTDLCILSHFYPVLKLMFAEIWDDMEHKSQKRANRKVATSQSDST